MEGGDFTPLMERSHEGDASGVQLLMEAKAELNKIHQKEGDAALDMARSKGHSAVVAMLAQAGDKSGLHLAINAGDATKVQLLLIDGASVQTTDGHLVSLHAASAAGHVAVVRCLLEAHASMEDGTATQGRTALHLASREGHVAVVEHLLGARANPKPLDRNPNALETGRRTPWSYANQRGHGAVSAILAKALHEARAAAASEDSKEMLLQQVIRLRQLQSSDS